MTAKTRPKDFESALKQLNQTVEKMEKGGLSLEESLVEFEQGVMLIRYCQDLLKKAEQKIQIYNKEKNQLEFFNDPDETNN
jgi:exodeoxyribonuclease VII small subunit